MPIFGAKPAVVSLLGVACAAVHARADGITSVPEGYVLVWHDEFNGDEIDPSRWAPWVIGPRRDAYNVEDAARLDGEGNLRILTRRESGEAGDRVVTGGVWTRGLYEPTFGFIEVRMKMHDQPGHWAAFWLNCSPMGEPLGNPAEGGVEMDVVEFHRRMKPGTVQHALHWDGYGEHLKSHGQSVPVEAPGERFHAYAIEWTPEALRYFVNGTKTWAFEDEGDPISQRSQYMILSHEVGTWAGSIADAELPDGMTVDWVRVWQRGQEAFDNPPTITRHADASAKIIAHRGAMWWSPENTLASADTAIAMGADIIEIDVRTSADGVLYVMHDSTIDRTTNGTGRFDRLPSMIIDRLDAGSWFHERFAGQSVPTLETFLEHVGERAIVYLDVKDAHVPDILELIDRVSSRDRVFFWFGDRNKARELRRLDPEIGLKINAKTLDEVREAHEAFDADMVEVGPGNLTAEYVQLAHELGMQVMLYTTAADRAAFSEALRLGVELYNIDAIDHFILCEHEHLESKD